MSNLPLRHDFCCFFCCCFFEGGGGGGWGLLFVFFVADLASKILRHY